MSLFKWIISQHAVLYTCTVKISHHNLCSCLCEKTIPLWLTYYIMLKVKGYIFLQRQVPVAQTTEKWTYKFKSILIKPIIIRAQRGYINHVTLYQTDRQTDRQTVLNKLLYVFKDRWSQLFLFFNKCIAIVLQNNQTEQEIYVIFGIILYKYNNIIDKYLLGKMPEKWMTKD
jgi:hypothetical protein